MRHDGPSGGGRVAGLFGDLRHPATTAQHDQTASSGLNGPLTWAATPRPWAWARRRERGRRWGPGAGTPWLQDSLFRRAEGQGGRAVGAGTACGSPDAASAVLLWQPIGANPAGPAESCRQNSGRNLRGAFGRALKFLLPGRVCQGCVEVNAGSGVWQLLPLTELRPPPAGGFSLQAEEPTLTTCQATAASSAPAAIQQKRQAALLVSFTATPA